MLSKSALTSKRRKVQNHWWELKEDVVTQFTKLFTSAQFLKASDELCNTFCIGCRIEGWEDEIRQTISSVQTGIPSPSNMKWEDIPRVLVESIPKFKNIDDLPQCDDTEKEDLKSQYHATNEMISKVLEGDNNNYVYT